MSRGKPMFDTIVSAMHAEMGRMAPWAPPPPREYVEDWLIGEILFQFGATKEPPPGRETILPGKFQRSRAALLAHALDGAPEAVLPPARPVQAPVPAPPPLPVRPKAPPAPPPAPAPAPMQPPAPVEEADTFDIEVPVASSVGQVPVWQGAPLAHEVPFSPAVMSALNEHYSQYGAYSLTAHALRDERPPNRGRGDNPLAGLPMVFLAVVTPKDAAVPPFTTGDTSAPTKIGAYFPDDGVEYAVHFLGDFDTTPIFTSPTCPGEYAAISVYEEDVRTSKEMARAAAKREAAAARLAPLVEGGALSYEALIAMLSNSRPPQ
jgi:hypothetical protein